MTTQKKDSEGRKATKTVEVAIEGREAQMMQDSIE